MGTRWIAAVLLIWATGCLGEPSQQAQVEDACTSLCQCQYISPTAVASCTDDCMAQVPDTVPQECLTCLASSDCSTVTVGGCNAACQINQPIPNSESDSDDGRRRKNQLKVAQRVE